MNKTFILPFAALALSATLLTPAHGATITLVPSTATPTAGSNFTVEVRAEGVFAGIRSADELFAYGFDVSSAPGGIITYLNFTPGPLFDAPLAPIPGTDVVGTVNVPPTFTLTAPIVEPLLLATLNFLAAGSGSTVLSISSDLINLNEGLQYLGGTDPLSAELTIDVRAASGVPEPNTMLMAALGLGLVAVYFRKP